MFSLEQLARIAHEANAALCRSIGDDSQASWEQAPDWQRESSVSAVRFLLENPDASPGDGHERWMREKLDAGWRYGPVKDAVARTHPCLVPFEQLPPEQQAKDYLLRAVVLSLARFVQQ